MPIYFFLLSYLFLGTAFMIYAIHRLTDNERSLMTDLEINAYQFWCTIGWPLYLTAHLIKSIKRGSFKRDDIKND